MFFFENSTNKINFVIKGREWLWRKTQAALNYFWENFKNDFDWFLKTDDDTFIVMENLRYLLLKFDPKAPWYLGAPLKSPGRPLFMSGGAGYLLSKTALKIFAENFSKNEKNFCNKNYGGPEDVNLAKCLKEIGVNFGDTRDEKGLNRFFPEKIDFHTFEVKPETGNWFWRAKIHQISQGRNCCSPFTISFHYLQPSMFYVMEFLIYHQFAFGIFKNDQILQLKKPFTLKKLKFLSVKNSFGQILNLTTIK